MPCKMTKPLQESLVNNPRLLNCEEWKDHLDNCEICYQEAKILDKTLELYLHLEKASLKFLPETQIWGNIQNKVQKTSFPYWKVASSLAVAAVFILVISLVSLQEKPQQIPSSVVTILPTGFKVVEIRMGQPFGTLSSQTQFIWTKNHFGISIENKLKEHNYSKISIGSRKQTDLAYFSSPQKSAFQELAYFIPSEMSQTNIQ